MFIFLCVALIETETRLSVVGGDGFGSKIIIIKNNFPSGVASLVPFTRETLLRLPHSPIVPRLLKRFLFGG